MERELINIGEIDNDGHGDYNRLAFMKCNSNFEELYRRLGDTSQTARLLRSRLRKDYIIAGFQVVLHEVGSVEAVSTAAAWHRYNESIAELLQMTDEEIIVAPLPRRPHG